MEEHTSYLPQKKKDGVNMSTCKYATFYSREVILSVGVCGGFPEFGQIHSILIVSLLVTFLMIL